MSADMLLILSGWIVAVIALGVAAVFFMKYRQVKAGTPTADMTPEQVVKVMIDLLEVMWKNEKMQAQAEKLYNLMKTKLEEWWNTD